MSGSDKGYRRFRTRGGADHDGPPADGLSELRALTDRETRRAEAPPRHRREERPLEVSSRERERRAERERRRRERRWWSLRGLGPGGWIGRIAVLLLVGFAVWATAGFLVLRGAVSDSNARITPAARAALDPPTGGMLGTPTNTLILGVDARRGETRARSDTILIMRTDPSSGRMKYLSIPRDFRVELPGQGTQKINAAFYFGGQAGAIKAVKRLTGIPINHVIVIKFNGLAKMVDALGGVSVNNPTAVKDCYYEAGQTVNFPQGNINLNGERALQFARVRKCDDDMHRAMRQQALVAGLKNRVLAPTALLQAPWRGAQVVRSLQTDIGTVDLMKLGWLQARLRQDPTDRIVLSGEPLMIDGIWYVVGTDPDRNEREIASFMGSS